MKPTRDPEHWPSPSKVADLGPLFAQPKEVISPIHPKGDIRPADYAEPAAQTDDGEKLLEMAKRAANAIMDAEGSFCMWQVRIELGKLGLLANDGHEKLDGLGSLGRRMGLEVIGRERPPAWAAKLLPASHLNVNSRWKRPGTTAQRSA